MGAGGSIQIASLLEPFLMGIPIVGGYAFQVAEITAVILIIYLSLVLGELASKQIATAVCGSPCRQTMWFRRM